MTRVIAGAVGGRLLKVPAGRATRPTSDRAREGLFGTVESILGPLQRVRVLDLYAGSGAVGLEALSRGAGCAVLVENSAGAIRAIRVNIAALGLEGACLVADRVEKVLARGPAVLPAPFAVPPARSGPPSAGDPVPPADPQGPAQTLSSKDPSVTAASAGGFGFVFADPPYALPDGEVAAMLEMLRERGWLAGGALVAVERASGGGPLKWPAGYAPDRVRRYGDTALWYGLAAGV
jgi:16S rRNA (guanine966-N2)-methyltransferase